MHRRSDLALFPRRGEELWLPQGMVHETASGHLVDLAKAIRFEARFDATSFLGLIASSLFASYEDTAEYQCGGEPEQSRRHHDGRRRLPAKVIDQ